MSQILNELNEELNRSKCERMRAQRENDFERKRAKRIAFLCDESESNNSTTHDDHRTTTTSISCESLNALLLEESLVCAELHQLTTHRDEAAGEEEEGWRRREGGEEADRDEGDDEDLREFQRIERDIKITELKKCLLLVRKQIRVHTNDNASAPLAEAESVSEETPERQEDDSRSRRPLTLYLPSVDTELDLVHHITTLGHDLSHDSRCALSVTRFTCSGYLHKLCQKSANKWRKRFFHFDRETRLLVYYKSKRHFDKRRKPNGGVHFDQIRDVYVDHNKTVVKSEPKRRFVFIVCALTRQFVLSTLAAEVMRIWIDVIFTGAQAYHSYDDNYEYYE